MGRRVFRAAMLGGLCASLAACSAKGPAPSSDSGSAKGMYGEYFLLGIFRPTGGTIVSTDGRINCGVGGNECGDAHLQTRYEWTQSVTLNAIPAPGFKFVGWAGDCTGKDPCTISTKTKTADSYVVAAFEPDAAYRGVYFVVTVQKPSGGTIRSSDSAIECGSAATATRCGPVLYPWKGSVTMTAVADLGFAFDSWGGDCSGKDPSCVLSTAVVATDKDVSALFTATGAAPPLVWGQGTWDQVVWQ